MRYLTDYTGIKANAGMKRSNTGMKKDNVNDPARCLRGWDKNECRRSRVPFAGLGRKDLMLGYWDTGMLE